MKPNLNLIGDFSIFGFTENLSILEQCKLFDRVDITTRVIDVGQSGHFFLCTTYGEVAETDQAVVLKLGLLHSSERSSISAQQLLDMELVSPQTVKADMLRGNALIVCFSKTSPEFCVYKTLLSMPQLYFSKLGEGGILCADGVKPLLALTNEVEINEEALVQHFLFRYVLGRYTFFKGIERLLSGELFQWHKGEVETYQLRDLRPDSNTILFDRADSQAIDALYEEMNSIMGAYLKDIQRTGYGLGSMISGGIDSTIMQLFINNHISVPDQRKTFSYIMETPGFEFEVEYVKDTLKFLETNHTFVTITPEEYPQLLLETIETLGFPIPDESYPCKRVLAKLSEENGGSYDRFFFWGNGADSLHGTSFARKITLLEFARHIPASNLALNLTAALISPWRAKQAHGLRQVARMLPELANPDAYHIPVNAVSVYSDIDMARRSFGDEALKKAFEYRRYLEKLYLGSDHHVEKVHMIELLTDAYECGVDTNHLYLAHKCEQIYFFMDEDVIRSGLAFNPNIRFLQNRKVKPLMRNILQRTPLAGVINKPKGASVFSDDLYDWMKEGPLREMVLAIERPAFLSKPDFKKLLDVPDWNPLDQPNWFLWNLLTFDIFKKHVVQSINS